MVVTKHWTGGKGGDEHRAQTSREKVSKSRRSMVRRCENRGKYGVAYLEVAKRGDLKCSQPHTHKR